ncbi:MAG: hypothetical protein KGL50_06445 [Burkholderiales bacterium]|nr:hypothetical protein [Burkholderiales bacterium]
MNKAPLWFMVLAAVALLWNLAGLLAVVADLAALPPREQAMAAARPGWSVAASVVAVVGGTLGCLGLLARRRWALWALYASVAGIVLQDLGLFVLSGHSHGPGWVPLVLQGAVFLIAVALLGLGHHAARRAWLG